MKKMATFCDMFFTQVEKTNYAEIELVTNLPIQFKNGTYNNV